MLDAGAGSWGIPCCAGHESLVAELWARSWGAGSALGWLRLVMSHQQVLKHLNVLVTSPAAPGQTVWPSSAEVGAVLPHGPHGRFQCGNWPCCPSALRLACTGGTESSPSKPGAEVNASSSWTTSKALRSPCQASSGLAGFRLPAPRCLPGAVWTAAVSWLQGTSTPERVGRFPAGLMEGHALSPQPSHHPGSPTTVWGRDGKKSFSHVSSHFNDCFSNYLKFLRGARCFHSW